MTAVVGCFSGGQATVVWYGKNHIIKDKREKRRLLGGFRRIRSKTNTISILGEEVEDYGYLDIHLDEPDWSLSGQLNHCPVQAARIFKG